ncbi:MAG: hypothetical protein AB7Q64_06530 [Verrucomicrobiales bacterium]
MHWKRERSALELAVSWELAQATPNDSGMPREVKAVIDTALPLKDAELLMGMPEHKVTLNTSRAPSQTDFWALLRCSSGLISLSIEAKAGEPFDKTVDAWLNQDEKKHGREERLRWLCEILKSSPSMDDCGSLRYQLFHRTASALKEAERCGASAAVMLVQAFPGAEKSWADFERFGSYLGVQVNIDCLVQVPSHQMPQLYVGWVTSRCADDKEIAATLVDL